ncbi:MAG: FAD-dependent oxidoreductase [Anaerolineae bacterium]|nr:FAD-dependent oxidoreductase [Anaerolineae bacterium]
MHIRLNRQTLPVTHAGDVVVAGGSFAGVAAALALARAGREVILAEPRTYLGREVTATLRPWIDLQTLERVGRTPPLIASCIQASGGAADGDGFPEQGEIPLRMDALKCCLEDLLLDAGVALIYASVPVGVDGGLIVGNKSGRQLLACRVILDATATASVARAVGASFEPWPAIARFSRTLEFDGVHALGSRALPVPQALRFVDNVVHLHRGCRGQGHVYVECAMDLPLAGEKSFGAMRREIVARQRCMDLASFLIAHVPTFHHAFLAATSYELCGMHTPGMAGGVPDWAREFGSIRVSIPGQEGSLSDAPLAAFAARTRSAAPVRTLFCLQEAARLDVVQSALFHDPVMASLLGEVLAERLVAHWDELIAGPPAIEPAAVFSTSLLVEDDASAALTVAEPESPQRGRPYPLRAISPMALPVLRSVDVLVVGGGTSGATAAVTAAEQGLRTLLIEMNPGLGGTGTLGGVDSYWFGRRVGFAARVEQSVGQVHDALDYEGRRWNIEAKMHALLQQAEGAGVELVWNAVVIGAVVEENQVRGVAVAGRYGPFAVLGRVVIDATGDGDVAAFAGAAEVGGAGRDREVMWYSLAQFVAPGRTQNNFTSMVDVSNVADTTRAILAGRRRGGTCHDHGIYVAPRESRHILGDAVITLDDQLAQRRWPDVVNIHFSNHDIKGKSSSPWLNIGLIPPNLEIEIPYRALLPQGLEQILVAGKAISATRDALPAIRMQADLENLGGVVGLAAAQAIRQGVAPRDIKVADLQRALVERGVLPEAALTRSTVPQTLSDADLEALVALLDADRPLYAYSDMGMDQVFRERIPIVAICAAGEWAVPVLERALAEASSPAWRVRLAQALAMCGSPAAVPVLIAEIERALAAGVLPPRTSEIRHTQLPPDQGAMPDTAYLLYALGLTRDPRALAVWARGVDLLEPSEEALRDRYKGLFYYVDAVCDGARRLGDPAAVPILKQLHGHALLRDQVSRDGFQADFFHERQAMLELAIGRALARCGSAEGVEILIAYLDDSRALLAETAHAELTMMGQGQDYGKDAQAWAAWLERRHRMNPKPDKTSPLKTGSMQ